MRDSAAFGLRPIISIRQVSERIASDSEISNTSSMLRNDVEHAACSFLLAELMSVFFVGGRG